MMGLENPLHLALIAVVILMLFGAKRLPELGRSLGRGMREFKESVSGEDRPHELDASRAEAPAASPVQADSAAAGAAAAAPVASAGQGGEGSRSPQPPPAP